jgi:hypothetical protein
MSEYLIPIITVSGAFGAAFAGQYFAHRYARKREIEKLNRDSLQNFYSPLVYRIVDYLSSEGERANLTFNPFLGETENEFALTSYNEEDTNKMFKNILTFISEKLTHANQELIMKYEIAKRFGDFHYGQDKPTLTSTIFTIKSRMEVCSAFLAEYLSINTKLKTLSKRVKDDLEEPYFFTQVFNILMALNLHELAINHAFRDRELIQEAFCLKRSLLKDAELLLKRYDFITDNLDDYSSTMADELEADSYQFIYEMISLMKEFEEQRAMLWTSNIEEHYVKEAKKEKEIFKSLRNEDK